MPVDMRAKPYYLDDEAVQWVEDTIASMSLEEKIGQLFFNMGSSRTEEYLKMTVDKYHIGGIRYNPGTAAEVHEQNRILQENSKIPLIIACNTENGGNGACSNGTMIGAQTKIGATGDAKYAKALGKMANTEAAAIGCNLSFAPVSDIYYNWHNPVVGLRTYGNDPQRVMEMTQAYMEARTRCPASAARPSTSPATAWMTVTSMLPTASTPFPARNGTPPSAKSTQTSSTTGWRPSWPDISCFQAIPVP